MTGVGVIFYFLLSFMYSHLQKKLKKNPVAPVLSVGKQNCWQNERSEVKTGTFCSLNVLSQQRRRPLSECQLILLSPHQILYCFHISSTWLISDLPASTRSFTLKTSLSATTTHLAAFVTDLWSLWPSFAAPAKDQRAKQEVCNYLWAESHLDRKQSGQSVIVWSGLKWAGNHIFASIMQCSEFSIMFTDLSWQLVKVKLKLASVRTDVSNLTSGVTLGL